MSLEQNTQLLQGYAGVKQDGAYGPVTALALCKKLGLLPVLAPVNVPRTETITQRRSPVVCIDPGHGLSNRRSGLFDPGCERGDLHEADVVLVWANQLADALQALGVRVVWTRRSNNEDCPVGLRARKARDLGADTLISIHVNDDDSASANGIETLYLSGPGDRELAEKCQDALVAGLGLRDRGVKEREDLAVLKFYGRAVLLEVGFIGHAADVLAFTDAPRISKTCELLAAAIIA